MITQDQRRLMELLDTTCVNALQAAVGFAISREHYEIASEHLLLKLIEDGDGDILPILRHFDVDPGRFQDALLGGLAEFKSGNTGRPRFSPILLDLLEKAWLVSSVDLEHREIRSGSLLYVLSLHPEIIGDSKVTDLLSKLNSTELKTEFPRIVAGSAEDKPSYTAPISRMAGAGEGEKRGDTALDQFTNNITEAARSGKIDPVFARDEEIRQMIDILMRRRQNNPILVGEPGTGKTAIVEGLALRIASGDIPSVLDGVEIHSLDLGLLQAGAGVKGEFENRLRAVIDQIKSSPHPIITFIDEAHTLIGAGGAAGTGDAANLIKPALARGELRTVAATTWSEYKKYFEKDPALERRFQPVKVEEPSLSGAVTMLRGLKKKFEEAHQVRILDSAVQSAVELSHRYISGRFLPDKAVSLLDTAAARVKVNLTSTPYTVEAVKRRIDDLEVEIAAREKDLDGGTVAEDEELPERRTKLEELRKELEVVSKRFQSEQEAAHAVLKARGDELPKSIASKEQAASDDQPDEASAEEEDAKPAGDIAKALATFREIQGEEPMLSVEVDAELVARVVADWTGVPVGKMVQDEAGDALKLTETLGEKLLGQGHALEAVTRQVQTNKAGLTDPDKPMGVFLLVGPSGVGKTELALLMADQMFGGDRFIVKINMSEYQEEHTLSRLIGSPPGYVGFGEGGILTEAVRQRPYSVVLLDEVEKAHPKIMQLFLQVFDKGECQDGEGRTINFKNTLIFLTSNLGFQTAPPEWQAKGKTFEDWLDHVTGLGVKDLAETLKPLLRTRFMPEFLARLTIVPFYPISPEIMRDIARLKLDKVVRRMAQGNKIELLYDTEVTSQIADRCTEVQTGARNVDHILSGTLLPLLSRKLLEEMAQDKAPAQAVIGVDDKGDFTLTFR